jgi:lipid II:glycine glycyltransferase (peptidoglycan interpeptide bridge formation enzyme)
MKFEVRDITDKKTWENFSLSSHPNTFLQSWNWGEFNKEIGRKIFRLGVFKDKKLSAITLFIKHETQLGSYLYCPRGPLFDWKDLRILDQIIRKISQIGKEEDALFVKMEPLVGEKAENRMIFKDRGFIPAVTFVQVEDAWLLSLNKSEDELLMNMRKTTRYLIRHEPKQGIKIQISDRAGDVKSFAEMLYATSARKGFVNHPKEYYIKQFAILSRENQMRIFKAVKKGKTLAMAVVAFYGGMAYYLHGASTVDAQSAGYPLQWEVIKEAKRRGLGVYNFWGIVKDKNFHPGHPWYGFSLFKRGFGGGKFSHIRAQDLPLSPRYWVYRYAEKARRLLRRIRYGYWED